jgi:sodium-coupled neutral amino acid transporter 10
VEVIIGFVGSTIGVLICVIFPATCFVKIMQRNTSEKVIAQVIIVCGFIIMILGTYSNLNALDSAKSGSHIEVKIPLNKLPDEMALKNLHPKDIIKIEDSLPIERIVEVKKNESDNNKKMIEDKEKKSNEEQVLKKPEENLNKNNEVDKAKVPEAPVILENSNKMSDDSIKKEEQEIAVEKAAEEKQLQQEKSDDKIQIEIKEKDKEISELKASKDKLEKEVLEMKQVIVKQNKETQQLVLQKFEEIAEKVDKIEKHQESSAKEENKKSNDQPENDLKKLNEVDESEIKEVKEIKIIDNVKEVKELKLADEKIKDKKEAKKIDNLLQFNLSNEKIEEKPEKNDTKNAQVADLIVKLIKDQEPLSYQVGEKMAEEKKHGNLTASIEKIKDELKLSNGVIEEDMKNEMRKKRSPSTDISNDPLLNKNSLNIQLMAGIGRDLKNVKSDEK